MNLGDNIRYLRIQHNYSQDDLAEKFGYKSYTTIQKWESGVSTPPIKVLQELSLLFNVDMDDLANKDFSTPSPTTSTDTKLPKILEYYNQLNSLGKKEAEKRIYELTQLDTYIEIEKTEASKEKRIKRLLTYSNRVTAAHNDHVKEP